jgi:lon-related putative ATP-dependent protease
MAFEFPEVGSDQLKSYCDPNTFAFETTENLPPLDGTVGQDRGVNAIIFGLGIKTQGFNMYVAGPVGTGKSSTTQIFVTEQAKTEPVPDDLCYVHNFRDSDSPSAILLPPGKGCRLVTDMEELVDVAKRDIPRAFEDESYEKKRNDILNTIQQEKSRMLADLQEQAQGMGLAIEMTNVGIVTIPLNHGKPISREDFAKFGESEQRDIEKRSEDLQNKIQQVLAKARKIEKAANEKIRQLDRDVALFAVGHRLDDLKEAYKDFPAVHDYLAQVQNDMMDHLEDFKEKEHARIAIPGLEDLQEEPSFDRYKVNLIVENTDQKGAPIVYESNPTYYNLIGRVDFRARLGALTTDFTMIKAGAMHKANGGYLILQALDVLVNPMAWDALKRAVRSREVRMENLAEHYGLIPTSTLKPEPIPVNVKVILVGNAQIFHLLYAFDEDFHKLFKVKADFDTEMPRTDDHVERYAQFIAARVRESGLKHFDRTGVAKIVEYGSRLIQDKDKLSTRFIEVADVVSEASFWASKNGGDVVTGEDVKKAIEEKEYRSNLVEEKIQELMENGVIMIDCDGSKVGQVNGLSVYSIGDYTFGRPSRITARTFIGRSGVTNIERETKMSGPIHNKGVLILSGYLSGKYANEKPLPLGASLTFEQLYEGVEGDSASSTELYAILSSLSEIPIKQNIAVTGSVNQLGEIQPIGGVTWKVEGFYEVCKAKGLTGDQGVMIPAQNVRHLMLKDEVVEAVRNGLFHVYPVSRIEEGIHILTGVPAGEKDSSGNYPPDSVHGCVRRKLDQFAESLKEYTAPESEKESGEDEGRIAARRMAVRGTHRKVNRRR